MGVPADDNTGLVHEATQEVQGWSNIKPEFHLVKHQTSHQNNLFLGKRKQLKQFETHQE